MNRHRGFGAAMRQVRMSLWLWPSMVAVGAYIIGTMLSNLQLDGSRFAFIAFKANAGGGRTLLAALVGGLLTALSVIFSLTITGLQTAHQRYSPRLLRNFLRDRPTKVTLAVFAGTVAYMLAVLRAIPASASGDPVPRIAIFGAMMLFMGCVGIVAYFVQHITNSIRVHKVMARIVVETEQAIDLLDSLTPPGTPRPALRAAPPEPGPGHALINASRSGYVLEADLDRLARWAREAKVIVRLRPMIGDQLMADTPVAWVWPQEPHGPMPETRELTRRINGTLVLGGDRSQATDIAYGFRQLVDIAVHAMSPALADPYTAMQSIDHLTILTCHLAARGLPEGARRDEDGRIRVIAASLDLRDFVRLACDQIRRYGGHEPGVAVRLLKLLEEVAAQAPASMQPVLRLEVQRILDQAEEQVTRHDDLDPVRDQAKAALAAIDGQVLLQEASYVRL